MIRLLFKDTYLQTASIHLLFVCNHWFFTYLNTAVSVTRVTFTTFFSVYMFTVFYRAMHFSAKRGIAIACRLSVCLSVCL